MQADLLVLRLAVLGLRQLAFRIFALLFEKFNEVSAVSSSPKRKSGIRTCLYFSNRWDRDGVTGSDHFSGV